jgi:lysozyme
MIEATGIFTDEMLEMIRKDEGLVLKVYKCPAGKKTVGYGHNIEAKGLPKFIDHYLMTHGFITTEMAEFMLDQDVSMVIDEVKDALPKEVWDALTPRRRMVLVMMAYNMGVGYLTGPHKWPKLCDAIHANDTEETCRQMKDSKWYHQVGDRAVRLIEMYRKG